MKCNLWTKLRAFHVPATRPRPYSHDWEEDWTGVLLLGGGVRGSEKSGEGFSFDKKLCLQMKLYDFVGVSPSACAYDQS